VAIEGGKTMEGDAIVPLGTERESSLAGVFIIVEALSATVVSGTVISTASFSVIVMDIGMWLCLLYVKRAIEQSGGVVSQCDVVQMHTSDRTRIPETFENPVMNLWDSTVLLIALPMKSQEQRLFTVEDR
jgi:hypothetical protein